MRVARVIADLCKILQNNKGGVAEMSVLGCHSIEMTVRRSKPQPTPHSAIF